MNNRVGQMPVVNANESHYYLCPPWLPRSTMLPDESRPSIEPGTGMQTEFEPLRRLRRPERLVIWASRHYLWSALRGTPVPEFVVDAFDHVGFEHLYYSLDRVLVCLMAAPTDSVTVHDVRCPCLSLHEQALIMALKRLADDDDHGYTAAMTAVMLPSAARVSQSAMKLLAQGLEQIEPERLDWLLDDDAAVDGLIESRSVPHRHRTIN